MISQRCLNRKPRPPRTAFKSVWDHTQHEDKTIQQSIYSGHGPWRLAAYILWFFATVKWTEWHILTPKPHWRKASPHSYAFRKRPWLPKSERQSDRKVICRLSLPVAYEMWFMETDLDWRIRTCLKATHAEKNWAEAVCTRKIAAIMERKWLILVQEGSDCLL